jgi:DHA1 family multidrug resistance protein-like MFS transporter
MAELGASALQAGVILGLYSLSSLLGNLGSGVLLDRLGRRLPMIVSLLVAGAVVALYALVRTPQQMMGLRVLHGLAGAVYVPALFALVSERAGANRTRAIGMTSALIGLTALVGPVTSGIVATYYGVIPVFWGVAIMITLAGLGALNLKEVYERPQRDVRIRPQAVWQLGMVRAAFWLTLGMTFTMGVLTFSLPVVLETAGFGPAYRGRMFGLFALIAVGLMAGVRSRAALGGASVRAVTGVAFLMLGALGLNWLLVPVGTWVSVVFYGIGFGLTFPAVNLLAYDHAPGYLRGTALAMVQAFYSLGYVLGPLTAGYTPTLAGTVGAGVALVMLILAALSLYAGLEVEGRSVPQ